MSHYWRYIARKPKPIILSDRTARNHVFDLVISHSMSRESLVELQPRPSGTRVEVSSSMYLRKHLLWRQFLPVRNDCFLRFNLSLFRDGFLPNRS